MSNSLLLDKSAVIWLATDPTRVPAATLEQLGRPEVSIHFSAVVMWEAVIKQRIGKLQLPVDAAELFEHWRDRVNVTFQPIGEADVRQLAKLPLVHRDPFDRMLACQAQLLDATVVSPDVIFDAYGVPRIW